MANHMHSSCAAEPHAVQGVGGQVQVPAQHAHPQVHVPCGWSQHLAARVSGSRLSQPWLMLVFHALPSVVFECLGYRSCNGMRC